MPSKDTWKIVGGFILKNDWYKSLISMYWYYKTSDLHVWIYL